MKLKVQNIIKILHKHGRVELDLIGLDIKKITIVKNKGFGLKIIARHKETYLELREVEGFLTHIAFFIESFHS